MPKIQFLYKRIINENSIKVFKFKIHEISWGIIKSIKDLNESYKKFIAIITAIHDEYFPKSRIKVMSTPWITRGISKSSKRKQKLYEKFLKNRTSDNEMN